MSWRWTANGVYSAAWAYNIQFEGSVRRNFKSIIWCSDAPLSCRVSAWLFVQGRCLTANALARRGWPNKEFCPVCSSYQDTAVHLLATCPMAIQLWCVVLQRCQLPPAFVPEQIETLQTWLQTTTVMLPKQCHRGWIALSRLTWWTLWKERNARIFNGRATTVQ